MLHNFSKVLTFGEISRQWARENAANPRGLDRNWILAILHNALCNGELDDAGLIFRHRERLLKTGTFRTRAGREMLANDPGEYEHDYRGDGTFDQRDKGPVNNKYCPFKLVTSNSYKYLNERLDSISSGSIDGRISYYMSRLAISRDSFRQWILQAGHDLPQFWFPGDDERTREPKIPKRGEKKRAIFAAWKSFDKDSIPRDETGRPVRGARQCVYDTIATDVGCHESTVRDYIASMITTAETE